LDPLNPEQDSGSLNNRVQARRNQVYGCQEYPGTVKRVTPAHPPVGDALG
jgi:hypothetical protein